MDLNTLPADAPASETTVKWLMPVRDGPADRSRMVRRGKTRTDNDPCKVSVMEILETQIIPRLLQSTEHSPAFISTDGTRQNLPTSREITRFAEICIGSDPHLPDAFVQGLIAEGLGAEVVFLHLLTPAARHLGYLWEEDLCDFTQVTVGLLRMQQITLRLGSEFQEKRKTAMAGSRAIFAPAPGSQHTLGVLMVSEFFRREGWQVWMELGASEAQLMKAVQKDWFDVIGLSVGTQSQGEDLAEVISQLRSASSNPHVRVLIGGPLLIAIPDFYRTVGADGAASDAPSAVQLAKSLLPASPASGADSVPAPARSASPGVPTAHADGTAKAVMARFRQFRTSRGITMKDAAAQLAISHASLTKYEQLDRQPKPEVLEKVLRWIESVQNQPSRMVKKR